jgi:hypothetical protein
MASRISAPDFSLSGLSVMTNGAWSTRVSPVVFQQWIAGGHVGGDTLVHWPMLAAQPLPAGSFATPQGFLPNVVPALMHSNTPFLHRGEVHCADGVVLAQCVTCGAPATQLKKHKLEKQHPAALVGLVLGVIGLIVMSAILNKRINVHIGMCDQHFAQRRKLRLAAFAIIAAGLLGFFAAIQFLQGDTSAWVAFAVLLVGVLAGIIVGTRGQNLPKLADLTNNVAKLSKVQPAVQQLLPTVLG